MGLALRLARRGAGRTSPNPMVGAVIVKGGKILGEGWHHGAGQPHAEVEAIRKALAQGHILRGASLFVTLEPCCTHGRTPPCTDAIREQGIARVYVGATDPNPKHAGRGHEILRKAGIEVVPGIRAEEATALNQPFNHWIVHRTPFVTVKAALSLDGKIATGTGESKWITGERSRAYAMGLREGADAILVGINTVLADDPRLTVRRGEHESDKRLRRIVLDLNARTPLDAQVVTQHAERTTVVVAASAPPRRVEALAKHVQVVSAPLSGERIDLGWLLNRLGQEEVLSLLVEGGGEVNASFLLGGWAHQIAFFYAPKILGGRSAPGAVGGAGVARLAEALQLQDCRWRRLGADFLLTARLAPAQASSQRR